MIVAGHDLETDAIPGEPGTPTLVFLHEGLGSAALWRSMPRELARRTGCGTLNYSRYGNGRSEVLAEARTPAYMHDEALIALPDLLAKYGIRDAVLIGHSDGASIALLYAGAHPQFVRGLVLEAPHVFVEDLSVESISQARLTYESTDLRAKLARYHADVDRTFYGWNDIWLHAGFRDWNIEAYVPSIRAPMLLIQGVDDEYGTLAQIEAIRRSAVNGRVDALVLAQCGHTPHRDRPAATLDAMESFVKQLRRES